MLRPVPRTTTQWHRLLRQYSAEFLDSPFLRDADRKGSSQSMVNQVQRKNRWLGYQPASEATVLSAEQRLGERLPTSYRNFLLTTDGWNTISYATSLLPAADINWLSVAKPHLVASWSHEDNQPFANELRPFNRCLLISDDTNRYQAYWLLYADKSTDDDEWAAYEWWPDEDDSYCYRSFAQLVTDTWQEGP